MIQSNELELQSNLTLGTLTSNAEAIRALVKEKLQDYTAINYAGRVDEAKSDRAILKNAEKKLNARRLELERDYMAPFNKFKTTIKEICDAIKKASQSLDQLVKAEEEKEKSEKKNQIFSYWQKTGFSLFELEKIFQPSWLNKTFKMTDVQKAIDEAQQKTFNELKIIENFPAEDVGLLKTLYLDTLDLNQAMVKAEELKANRDRLAREKVEREEIEKSKALENQKKVEVEEINRDCKKDANKDLVAAALEIEIDTQETEKQLTFALVLHGTRDKLMQVRRFMTDNSVTYEKLTEKENGIYTREQN